MRSHTIAIGLFMLAAVTALPHQGADEVVPEMDLAESNLAMEAFMQDQMQATSLYKLSPVTEAIVALKAYSIKAKEVFEDQIDLETATEGASSLVELVQILGVPMPEDGDVVTEFADAVLALRAKGGGLFDYLIKHVNLSVMRGKSPVAPVQAPGGGYFITFSPEVVGLQTMPEYFRTTLAVKGMGYQELKIQIETTVSDEYDPVSVIVGHAFMCDNMQQSAIFFLTDAFAQLNAHHVYEISSCSGFMCHALMLDDHVVQTLPSFVGLSLFWRNMSVRFDAFSSSRDLNIHIGYFASGIVEAGQGQLCSCIRQGQLPRACKQNRTPIH